MYQSAYEVTVYLWGYLQVGAPCLDHVPVVSQARVEGGVDKAGVGVADEGGREEEFVRARCRLAHVHDLVAMAAAEQHLRQLTSTHHRAAPEAATSTHGRRSVADWRHRDVAENLRLKTSVSWRNTDFFYWTKPTLLVDIAGTAES